MGRRIVGRAGFYLLAAAMSIVLNFFLPRFMPGDPASTLFARLQGKLKPEAMDALRETLGFTEGTLLEQFAMYLTHLLRGEMGVSVAYFPTPVSEVILTGLFWTLGLTGIAVLISFALGSFLGVLAAWKREGWLDSYLPPALSFLGAFPYFWLALLLLFVFGFRLDWFPIRHAYGDDLEPGWTLPFFYDVVVHGFLPALSIVLATLGGWMLSMRNNMLGVLGEDYIRLATAKGVPSRQVMWRYAARNALLPSVTGFGMALGFILGGSLLTEMVFNYPGTGYLLIQAVRNQDYPLMQGIFLLITLAVLVANFLVDLLVIALDPRARG